MKGNHWSLLASLMVATGSIGCRSKNHEQTHKPDKPAQKAIELSREERAKLQERRESEIKTVNSLYKIICAAEPAAKSNFEKYQGRDETLVVLDGLLHCGKLEDSEITINIKTARDKRGAGDVFKFIHRKGEDPHKAYVLAGSVIWLLSGRELNRQFKKYNWIDFIKDSGDDSHLRITPAITEHVGEIWGREFDIKKDCLMEVLVPAGVVEECREGARRWLNGERPSPRRVR